MFRDLGLWACTRSRVRARTRDFTETDRTMVEKRNSLSAAAFAVHADTVDVDGGTDAGRISSRLIYDGRVVHLSVDTVRFPDGSMGELEIVRHSGAAAVLAVLDDPATPDPRVLLVRQYRYAVGGELLEVPAGRPDRPGEDWEACARRELEEETGFRADRLVPLTSIYTTPGFSDERIHLFLALGVSPGTQALDADEFVEPVVLTMSDALARIRTGEIVDAKTVCTLHCAAGALRNELR